MNNIPEDENKIILNSINAHGIYFKKSVRQELEKVADLRICEEYPIHYFGGTQIDILARYQHENTLNILTIECKKAYAPYKKWIFFESCEAEDQLKFHYFYNNELILQKQSLFTRNHFKVCVEGIDIDLSSSSRNKEDKSKGSMDVIWKAANQITKGYYGFLLEELEFREKSSANELEEYNHCNILPLIVTNAPLFVISKEYQKASLETGNSDELIMSEVDYLILNHAFTPPKGVAQTWLQLDIPGYQNPIDRGNNSKIAVLVVNAKKLISLLNLLLHINQN